MMNSDTTKHPSADHRLVLAPMEGVIDSVMRDLLTTIGGYHTAIKSLPSALPRAVDWWPNPRWHPRIFAITGQ